MLTTNKAFPTYSGAMDDIALVKKQRVVRKDLLNEHVDVSPCANGFVYHTEKPPIF